MRTKQIFVCQMLFNANDSWGQSTNSGDSPSSVANDPCSFLRVQKPHGMVDDLSPPKDAQAEEGLHSFIAVRRAPGQRFVRYCQSGFCVCFRWL